MIPPPIGPNGGVLIRQSPSGAPFEIFPSGVDPVNAAQTAWFVDPLNGDDTNDGLTPTTAIQTRRQLADRLRYPLILSAPIVTVTVLNDVPAGDPFDMDLSTHPVGVPQVQIRGQSTTLLTTTLSAVQTENQTTNQRFAITAPVDWSTAGTGGSSLVDFRVRRVSDDSYAWIQEVDASPDTAFINQPVRRSGANINWAMNDQIIVERLVRFGDGFTMNTRQTYPFVTGLGFHDLMVDDTDGLVDVGGFAFGLFGCDLRLLRYTVNGASFQPGNRYQTQINNGSTWEHNFNGGWFVGSSAWEGAGSNIFLNGSVSATGPFQCLSSLGMFQGVSLGVWGWSGAALRLNRGSTCSLSGRLWGSSAVANSYGLFMLDASYFSFNNTPTIDGAHATQDALIHGVPLTFDQLPYIDPETLARAVVRG